MVIWECCRRKWLCPILRYSPTTYLNGLRNCQTSRNRNLIEKLTAAQLVNKFLAFYETHLPLPRSQNPPLIVAIRCTNLDHTPPLNFFFDPILVLPYRPIAPTFLKYCVSLRFSSWHFKVFLKSPTPLSCIYFFLLHYYIQAGHGSRAV
jgi:hypothetical protein